ncbi:ABC transporter substrate-binding protein [Carnobacteriaceae bacterium zg-C25]|nr:ABC transporter substrate-binding protein [Carnobacteriaceae bacterium zg-C25]
MKKKKLVLGMAAALLLAACSSQGNNGSTASSGASKFNELVVDSQPFVGDFFTNDFSNSAYDVAITRLIQNTGTVDQDANGKLLINKGVVTDDKLDRSTDADGNTVVTWHLRKDLKWSDGQPVTAKDYVFGTLFGLSKEWTEAGAQTVVEPAVLGAEAFNKGEAERLKAIKLIDDHTFSITIDKAKLPYFYELSYYGVAALPMHELAKGATISSTDEGSKLEGVDMKAVAENAKVTQVDSKKPTVTYGKYVLDKSSDTEIVLKANPNYVGNYEGVKPTIGTVTVKANSNGDLALQRLQKGEVDFAPSFVEASIAKTAEEDKTLGITKYNRNGYGFLGMANDFGPTKDINVRHAIAHLINRNQLITDVLGGGGVAINGQYAAAQWMAKEKEAELNSKLNKYSYDVAAANAALDKSDYRFEADGVTPFDASKASESYLRHNANKEVLEVKHLATDNNPVSTALETNLLVDAPKAGMKYSITKTDFPTLQKEMGFTTTAASTQQYHLYNLASNFAGAVVNPYNAEHSKNLGTRVNPWRINDKEIDRLSEEMKTTESTDTEGFANKWLAYQVRFNELLPFLPLYSNVYYNIYSNEKVATDPTTSIRDWSALIEYFRLK